MNRPSISEVTLSAQKNENGVIVGVLGIGRDVMERKRAQAELRALGRRLAEHKENEERSLRALKHERELNEMKDRFVSMVSHEFRTPLCVISMSGSLLNNYFEQMSVEDRAKQVRFIQSSVVRMSRMMDELLLFGKYEAGKMVCAPARVNLETLCRGVIAEVSKQAAGRREITCAIDPDAREAVLDEQILHHILSNLLGNAVKYSPSVGPPVTLAVTRLAANTRSVGDGEGDSAYPSCDYIRIVVGDSGIGIPAADCGRLFELFQRASNVGNRPGTGMGLAIVKRFVDLHGGTIRVDSVEGRGTSVSVCLPNGPRDAAKISTGDQGIL